MAGIADFLRREGWRVNMSEGCPKEFPLHMGVMFLIGRQADQASQGAGGQAPQASQVAAASRAKPSRYSIVWLDSANGIQVHPISLSGSRMEVTFGGQEYKLTAKPVRKGGKPCLEGTVSTRKNGKGKIGQDQIDIGYAESGTWGAEGNGGGPGGMCLAGEVIEATAEVKRDIEDIKKKLAQG